MFAYGTDACVPTASADVAQQTRGEAAPTAPPATVADEPPVVADPMVLLSPVVARAPLARPPIGP